MPTHERLTAGYWLVTTDDCLLTTVNALIA
jgi:hypothetical protein